ncbi:MAG: hypothetical protein R3B41_00850 [Candidatus Doudnabacteria bacterium]
MLSIDFDKEFALANPRNFSVVKENWLPMFIDPNFKKISYEVRNYISCKNCRDYQEIGLSPLAYVCPQCGVANSIFSRLAWQEIKKIFGIEIFQLFDDCIEIHAFIKNALVDQNIFDSQGKCYCPMCGGDLQSLLNDN